MWASHIDHYAASAPAACSAVTLLVTCGQGQGHGHAVGCVPVELSQACGACAVVVTAEMSF